MISWPAVIKYQGDDELTYVHTEKEWLSDAGSHLYHHRDDDQLIDSSGRIFSLNHVDDNTIMPENTGKQILLEDFIRLVRIHASSSHRCCIEKINFRTIAEGISLVNSLKET